MTAADFTELLKTAGVFGTVFFILIVALWSILRYLRIKVDEWGEPWVKGQIDMTNSVKVAVEGLKSSAESQAESLKSQSASIASIKKFAESQEKSTAAQTQSNKLVAIGLAQLLDASKGVSKEQIDKLEFNFRKLEEHVLQQDAVLNLVPKEHAESITDPKLKMEPMQKHELEDAKLEIEELKEEMKPEAEKEA